MLRSSASSLSLSSVSSSGGMDATATANDGKRGRNCLSPSLKGEDGTADDEEYDNPPFSMPLYPRRVRIKIEEGEEDVAPQILPFSETDNAIPMYHNDEQMESGRAVEHVRNNQEKDDSDFEDGEVVSGTISDEMIEQDSGPTDRKGDIDPRLDEGTRQEEPDMGDQEADHEQRSEDRNRHEAPEAHLDQGIDDFPQSDDDSDDGGGGLQDETAEDNPADEIGENEVGNGQDYEGWDDPFQDQRHTVDFAWDKIVGFDIDKKQLTFRVPRFKTDRRPCGADPILIEGNPADPTFLKDMDLDVVDRISAWMHENIPESAAKEEWLGDVKNARVVWEEHRKCNPQIRREDLYRAFCCYNCVCKRPVGTPMFKYKDSDQWHGTCCHGRCKVTNKDTPPNHRAVMRGLQQGAQKAKQADRVQEDIPLIYRRELKSFYDHGGRSENTEGYRIELEHPLSLLEQDEGYCEHRRSFRQEVNKARSSRRSDAVVIDMFSGIGGAIVALKRIGIAMDTVIHIDHDAVANHVLRFNHDRRYNSKCEDDGINHIFEYKKFEDLYDNGDKFETFMEKHAPIDLVVGGPPCQEFTGTNGTRQGTSGEQVQMLLKFGDFIERIRTHRRQNQVVLFHLCENGVVTDEKDKDEAEKAFGSAPIILDAHLLSPARRSRMYFTSILIRDIKLDSVVAKSEPSGCLADNWTVPAKAYHPDETKPFMLKVNTFMASLDGLDDERMVKVKAVENRPGVFEKGTFDVNEREKLLGLPENYVKKAVEDLFLEITNAFLAEESGEDWTQTFNWKYLDFACGGSRYKFASLPCPPYLDVLIKAPTETLAPEHYSCEKYAKRLIGNGFSIPLLQHLLQPLEDIFRLRRYAGYCEYDERRAKTVTPVYAFHWPPYNLALSDEE